LFEIEDTGIGIETEKQGLLLNSFVQADSSVSRQYGGTGLGLSICKSLIEKMKGNILLFSEGLEKGTFIVFTLPIAGTIDSPVSGHESMTIGFYDDFSLFQVRENQVDIFLFRLNMCHVSDFFKKSF